MRPALLPALLLCCSAAWASLSVYVPPEELARRATLVVEGTVVRVAAGFDPADNSLATYVTLEVRTVHRGRVAEDRLVLREPGGAFGEVVHELDAVPVYRVGETVLVFLEPSRDGALRTAGMFFGKYTIAEEGPRGMPIASRELDGHGRILGNRAGRAERMPLADLLAVVAAVGPAEAPARGERTASGRGAAARSPRREPRDYLPVPAEYDRLAWDGAADQETRLHSAPATNPAAVDFSAAPAQPPEVPQFTLLSSSYPTRWYASDQGTPVAVNIERAGNPLGDGAAAAAEMRRALAAWTDVPEARLVLSAGDDDYDYTGSHSYGPADGYSGINIVLFDDPYDDISDPTNCLGVLALGGYWRSKTTGPAVNGVTFHFALQLYVIFNNGFECFLGDPDNLAEVGAHELGHGIGLGHSYAPDAIMRSFAYGWGRGPRLGLDDRDAAHCVYPHGFQLLVPDGGESWEAGTWQAIEWISTEEAGPEAGEVDLEYSGDGGQSWKSIASAQPNDGLYWWSVPDEPTTAARVRVVRKPLGGDIPEGFPPQCSGDGSDSAFTISAPRLVAGSVPDGSGAAGLELAVEMDGSLRLSWEPSCSADATDHAIYEGSLDALRSGSWDHAPITCSAGPDLVEYVVPGAGNRYFVVAPLVPGAEGGLGRGSDGSERPASALACLPREADSSCP